MGFIKDSMNDQVWERTQKLLRPKDGKLHVIMFNSFSKIANQNYDVESKWTTEIGEMTERLQDLGYEIVDIKFNSIQGQGLNGQREGFNTLIMYR